MRLLAAVLCSVVAAAQAPAPNAKPGTVDGVVTNSVNGEPVRKAVVTLRNNVQGFGYQAVTDAAGRFHFDKVDPGSYSLTASRDGFAVQMPGRRDEKQLSVTEEQNVAGIAIALRPLAQVGGHVLDEDGEPIALAHAMALRIVYEQGRKQLQPVAGAQSNDLGEFQFVNLDAGRFYFRVLARPRLPNLPPHTRMSRPEEAYPPTYYPTTASAVQATAVTVTPGAEINGLDFRLRKSPAYHVRGKVMDGRTGQPAHDLGVVLEPDGAEFVPGGEIQAGVRQDGTFDLRAVVNGSYVVSIQNWRPEVAAAASQHIQVADQDVSVLLTLSPGFEISGRFSVEGTAPEHMNAQVFLNSERHGNSLHAEVATDGTFTVANVAPNTYRITALAAAPGLYVKSIRFGDQDITDELINLSQPGGSINILFGTDGGAVQGTVEAASGEPAPNAPVTVAPAGRNENRVDLVKQSGTDQYGHFKFQDLPPGDYQVFAWGGDEFDFGLVQNAEFRKALSGQAASVSVGPNGSESVQLKLISAEDIEQAKGKLP